MRETARPEVVTISDTAALTDAVRDRASASPEKVLFARKTGDRWVDVTAKEFASEVSAIAA